MLKGRNNRTDEAYKAYYGMGRLELLEVLLKENGFTHQHIVGSVEAKTSTESVKGSMDKAVLL
jgi:hypothetical protein